MSLRGALRSATQWSAFLIGLLGFPVVGALSGPDNTLRYFAMWLPLLSASFAVGLSMTVWHERLLSVWLLIAGLHWLTVACFALVLFAMTSR